jgi:ribosomal protein S26
VCHHCCRRIPRDHARKRAQGTTVLTAFDTPIALSLQYDKGGGGASYFPVSAITDRLYARNQLCSKIQKVIPHEKSIIKPKI